MTVGYVVHILGALSSPYDSLPRIAVQASAILILSLLCCAFPLDHLREVRAGLEAQHLHCGYVGVFGASSSVQADKDRILDDVGDEAHAVDRSINILIASGMSTPSLRAADAFGIDVHGAANARVAV